MKTIKVILFLLSSLTLYGQCLQMDIIVLVDASQSVEYNRGTTSEGLGAFLERFDYSDNGIRASVLLFASEVAIMAGMGSSKELIMTAPVNYLGSYGEYGQETNMTLALRMADAILSSEGRPDVRQVVLLITDGRPNKYSNSIKASEELKSHGVTIYGVLIDAEGYSEKQVMKLCTPGCYMQTAWEYLIDTLKKLDICS